MKKGRRLLGLVAVVGLLLAAGLVLTAFGRAMYEQTAWQPQGEGRLWVTSVEHASGGILLTVEAKSGVAEVWRSDQSLLAWRPQHRSVDFHVISLTETTFQVLVDYELVPGREWLLALRSVDGHWVSMSPYFPDAPTIPDARWRELLSRAERVGARPR